MKILQIIQRRQLRGAEIFACQLSTELIKRDAKVDIVYLFEGDRKLDIYGLNFIPLHANEGRRLWDFPAYKRLAAIVKTGGYDIVQANAGDTLKYAALSKKLFGWNAKLIFRNANLMSSFLDGKMHRLYNRMMLGMCDYFVSVSENCRKDLITLYKHSESISVTIPIGTYGFENVKPIDIDGGAPVFISIGSLVPEKNHIFLLEIFDKYVTKYGCGTLWIVGDGVLRSALEKRVQGFSWKDRVTFWGYRNDVAAILKAADVLVMPSLIEGLPGTILEAISCEIPVVASAVGGIPEIIEDNITGMCLQAYDSSLYATRLQSIVHDKALRERIVAEAKTRLQQRYTMERITSEFLQTYSRMTNSSLRNVH